MRNLIIVIMVYLSVCQVNLQKAREASQLFQNLLQSGKYLGCVTEPYTVANKVVFRPIGYNVIPEATIDSVPRAALYVPRDIDAVQIGNLCVPDCAVVQLKWQRENFLIVSGYMDINLPVNSDWLTAVFDHVSRYDLKLLLALDTNAHSSFYSLAQSNERGRRLEDIILRNMLRVENLGNVPTFQTVRAQSVIDVTLTRGVGVWNWHVDQSYNASDHNSIFYDIEVEKVPPREVRPWDKADWRKFTDALDKQRQLPDRMTCKKLDKEIDKLYKDIDAALDDACPKYLAEIKPKKTEWYTDKIRLLHFKVRKQYKKAIEINNDDEWNKLTRMKRKFRRRCRRAKTITWRKFVDDTDSETRMAQLSRIALHRDRRSLNVLYRNDGQVTSPGEETIDRLAEVHFPQAIPFDQFPGHTVDRAERTEVIMEKFPYVNTQSVRRSLRKFKPKKAPGPDQLKPVVFRYFPVTILNFFVFLYKCCLHLHYTPRKWQEALVVFIPKPGKKDYREGKSHRPIVLSNFSLKGLERLITWEMDKKLVLFPIHPLQHGFQIGKGTEAALSNTCDYIEKFVLRRNFCLGVFLDITSAYDSMNIDHIRHSLYRHGGEEDLVEWYYNYLSYRVLHVNLHGQSRSFICSQGFPQGGVASAKFWIIAFNPAIEIINRQFTVGNGYADDLSVVFGGNDPDPLSVRMQRVIDELVTWGLTCNLRFNPEKTVMVGFTRAVRKSFTVPVYMQGVPLKFVDSVKYLGLTLDKRLNWRKHILDKIALCSQYLLKMANIAHTTWGPKPHLMRWVYRCMVRPKITYGAIVWFHSVEKSKSLKKKLRRLNRLGMNTYATVHRSSPTRGLEIIYDTIPLELYIRKEATCAYVRLQNVLTLEWLGFSRRNPRLQSHLYCLQQEVRELGVFQVMQDIDTCDADRPVCRFSIRDETFRDRNAYRDFLGGMCKIFTDGSKSNGRVGSAYIIFIGNQRIKSEGFRLSDFSTVFQAEIYAIKQAALYVSVAGLNWPIVFFVDSQASLQALKADRITSRVVYDTIRVLNDINTVVDLVWVPAHSGVEGNELVDTLAKESCLSNFVNELPIPKIEIRNIVINSIRRIWNEIWAEYPEARMTKYFFPRNDKEKAKAACKLTRLQLGRFVRAITGHNNLRYYQSKIDITLSPICRFCQDDMETFHHFVFECPSLHFSRQEVFLDQLPDMDMNWSVSNILKFSYLPHINRLFDPNAVHDIRLVDTESGESESDQEVVDDPDPML